MGPLTVPERYCIVYVSPVDCEELGSYRRSLVAEHEADEHDLDAIHWERRFKKSAIREKNMSHKVRRACVDLQGEVLLRGSDLHWDGVRAGVNG